MIDTTRRDDDAVVHHIQRHILRTLSRTSFARYKDMRPPSVDSNVYAYHLKVLVGRKFIEKEDGRYRLSALGLEYVDRVSQEKFALRQQPKIITMLVIQDDEGRVLLQRRTKQPYIDTWTLVYGKLHMDDKSVLHAAHREAKEKTGLSGLDIAHAGDAYLRVSQQGSPVTTTFAHVFYAETTEDVEDETLMWCDPAKLGRLDLAPCVEAIVARTFFRDPFFFEEFHENWRG